MFGWLLTANHVCYTCFFVFALCMLIWFSMHVSVLVTTDLSDLPSTCRFWKLVIIKFYVSGWSIVWTPLVALEHRGVDFQLNDSQPTNRGALALSSIPCRWWMPSQRWNKKWWWLSDLSKSSFGWTTMKQHSQNNEQAGNLEARKPSDDESQSVTLLEGGSLSS